MALRATPLLTRITFRRDVRLFFGALVGFLSFLIVLLLLLLQGFLNHTREAIWNDWIHIARATEDAINAMEPLSDPASIEAQLSVLQTRYGMAGVALIRPGHPDIAIGVLPTQGGVEQVRRDIHGGTVIVVFDSARITAIEWTFRATAVVCIAATIIVTLLLALYLPRITKPIEDMLSAAREIDEQAPGGDEQQYLIETFRKSIATLKSQEAELQRMHKLQKSRADDLERVTAVLTRSLSSGFMAVDPEGNVVEINAAGREIINPAGSPNGLPIEIASGTNAFSETIRRAVDERLALNRVELRMADAHVIGLTTAPLMSSEQQFLGLLALFTDLTPIRELERRVRELQTLADLGEISAGIAHEFRNSLTTILGYLRLARREALPERGLAPLEKAEQEAALLSATVDSLLAFARPMQLAKSKVDLLELIKPIAANLEAASGIEIDCRGDEALIEGDIALLSRAFENLLRNAVESVQEKGQGSVRVTVSRQPMPRVEIEDSGVGLDSADVPRLLLPFQSQKPSGYGLGLPLARKIILLHGGRLELRGSPGQGACAVADFAALEQAQFVTVDPH